MRLINSRIKSFLIPFKRQYHSSHHNLNISNSSSSSYSNSKSSNLINNSKHLTIPVRPATSIHPKPIHSNHFTLGAAALLSRSPLLLKPLSTFELSYYQYQSELNHAISKPILPSFFFRPGSHAAKAFELSLKSSQSITQLDPINSNLEHLEENQNFHDIQRAPTRFIHLLFKLFNPSNQSFHWQLATNAISGPSDDLTQASLRAIHKNAGPDMDIWSIGKVPATFYKPPINSGSKFDKVWVMPQRILRGQVKIQSIKTKVLKEQQREEDDDFQIQDFGWFYSEEIKDRVDLDLWRALEPILK